MATNKKTNKLLNIGMIVAAIILVVAIAMIAVGLSGTEDNPSNPETPAATDNATADTPTTTNNDAPKSEAGANSPEEKQAKQAPSAKQNDKTASSSNNASTSTSSASSNKAPTNSSDNASSKQSSSGKPNQNKSPNSQNGSSSTTPKPAPQKQQEAHSVTISIVCTTILKHKDQLNSSKHKFVPQNGVLLSPTTISFEQGQTVFDVLRNVCREQGIQLEFAGQKAYIEGIGNLYEFDCGEQSGWTYKVNGVFPNHGCSEYVLKDNDEIVWSYTCEGLGADVGATNE